MIRSRLTWKCSSNRNKPNSEMQPLITVKRDNIQHDNDIDENLCFLGFSNALYLVDAFICFSVLPHLKFAIYAVQIKLTLNMADSAFYGCFNATTVQTTDNFSLLINLARLCVRNCIFFHHHLNHHQNQHQHHHHHQKPARVCPFPGQ